MKVVSWPWANIEHVRTLSNVVQEDPDNIAQEKILINVVLIVLRQHSTGKNLVQFCRRDYRQHCTGKILFNVFLILLRQHCTDNYPMRCCP